MWSYRWLPRRPQWARIVFTFVTVLKIVIGINIKMALFWVVVPLAASHRLDDGGSKYL
jgi:hypothetical protein